MITRFSRITCPKCGIEDKPAAREPGEDRIEDTLLALPFIGAAGAAYGGWRRTQAILVCRHCGEVLTTSLADKGAEKLGEATGKLTDLAARLNQPKRFCTQCGQRLRPDAKFCDHCGASTN